MRSALLMLAVLLLPAPLPARAGELDLLLDRLVEKNVLAPGEAQEIRQAPRPMLLQSMKLRGDVRLRYQFNDNRNKRYNQHRGRYRLRFFADAKVNEKVNAGFGFASGNSPDPRSANQTFGDNFGKKNLYIDSVFAEYIAGKNLSITAGRARNPLWLTSDMLWDADINMEGLSARVTVPIDDNWQFFGNAGFMALGESSSDPQDPVMFFAQPGLSWHDDAGVYDLKAGAAVYSFNHVRHSAPLAHRPSAAEGYLPANTLKDGKYKYGYDAVSPELELNAKFLSPRPVPLLKSLFGWSLSYAGVFGNYIRSTDHSKNGEGWLAGFRLGQRKVEGAGQWQLRYSKRRLGRDAWLDSYPDSDFYGGSAGVKGDEVLLTLGLLRDFALDLNWYGAAPMGEGYVGENLFQADVNLKF